MSIMSSEVFQFQRLPEEVQQRIMRFVIDPTLKDAAFLPSHVLRYATVCSKWKNLLYPLIRTVNTRFLIFDVKERNPHFDDAQLIEALFYFVRKFSNSIRYMYATYPRQRGLVLNSLVSFSKHPPSLPIITGEQLEELLTLPARLEALSLCLYEEHKGIEANIVSSVRGLPALKEFKLDDRQYLLEPDLNVSNSVVLALPDSCPLLEVIDLTSIPVTDKALIKLGKLCYLKTFRLCDNEYVTDQGIKGICNGRGCIQELSLKLLTKLTNRSAMEIATGRATHTYLKCLELVQVKRISNLKLCAILAGCQQLCSFEVYQEEPSSIQEAFLQYDIEYPGKCLNLQKLKYFHGSHRLGMEFEKVQCLGALKTLHVDCQNESGFKSSMLVNHSKLRYLMIHSSCRFSAASVQALSQCSNLEVFVLCNTLDALAVTALIDVLSTRLIKLAVQSVPKECVEPISKAFTKLTHIWLGPGDPRSAPPREELRRLSKARVIPPSKWERDGFYCMYFEE